MTSQIQEVTEEELSDFHTIYENYTRKKIDELKLKKENFKFFRTSKIREWAGVEIQKKETENLIQTLKRKIQGLEQREKICRISIRNKSSEISKINKEIKDLEKTLAAPRTPPANATKKEESSDEEEELDDFIQRGTGIDPSDGESDTDHGFNDIKKSISLFHDLNNAFNESIRDDPELCALLELDYPKEEFTYTSIRATKKP